MAGNGGCVGLPGFDGDLLASLGLTPDPLVQDGGNVVITCENATGLPAQWQLAWQRPGEGEPSTLAVTIEPGKSKTLSVEGSVERITAGNLDGWSVGVVIDPSGADPHAVSYSSPPLENGVDFRSGDVIRYSVSSSGGGRFLISAEIAPGG